MPEEGIDSSAEKPLRNVMPAVCRLFTQAHTFGHLTCLASDQTDMIRHLR